MMTRIYPRTKAVATAFILLLLPLTTQADINQVATSPATFEATVNGGNTLNVTWQITRTETGGVSPRIPVTRLVSSDRATLRINGSVIATLKGSLSKNSGNLTANVREIISFSETLTLNTRIARKIANAPAGSMTITRTFTDTLSSASGGLKVFASLGNSGPLSINRIELHFDNDSRTDVVQKGDSLHAVAEINFKSNGLLRGEWRIVDAAASMGAAHGRTLQVVRQQLVSSGEGKTRIISPPLPTSVNGLHLVSFVVEETDGSIDIPILRYFVLENLNRDIPENIRVITPGNNASIDENTVFSWQSSPGAVAYQLEIFEQTQLVPISGKVVPGTELKLNLSALSLNNLAPGKTYEWQIRAFGHQGITLGRTPRMLLHLP